MGEAKRRGTFEERRARVVTARNMIGRIDMSPLPGEPNLSRADVFRIVRTATSRGRNVDAVTVRDGGTVLVRGRD